MFRGIVVAAQSPQWLSRCADAQRFLKRRNKEVIAAQSPQGLSRCADAQHFLREYYLLQ